VTVYEVLTRQDPFKREYTMDVVRKVCFENGHVPIPEDNSTLSEIMKDCFQFAPNSRPTFEVIVSKLEKL